MSNAIEGLLFEAEGTPSWLALPKNTWIEFTLLNGCYVSKSSHEWPSVENLSYKRSNDQASYFYIHIPRLQVVL